MARPTISLKPQRAPTETFRMMRTPPCPARHSIARPSITDTSRPDALPFPRVRRLRCPTTPSRRGSLRGLSWTPTLRSTACRRSSCPGS
ncbi:predicted protein [Micromonas commoda]|uniref:Uncharacterized protein n=1 Tax=Micromonas commoda (strain RCC299 / NOUM17 / CCMP2709) TaxID=296587 RepID=C1EJP7_MICCC|nr:predicted protein [Micromonas commoda]ACO68226.1 predicted protein [Micromonas commoda]|eukprot:XP_002506968.1 predicted protein [Micromonas commoda]